MNMATTRLTSHAAKGEVPKYFIGIQFWISGEPAEVIVNVTDPNAKGYNKKELENNLLLIETQAGVSNKTMASFLFS